MFVVVDFSVCFFIVCLSAVIQVVQVNAGRMAVVLGKSLSEEELVILLFKCVLKE